MFCSSKPTSVLLSVAALAAVTQAFQLAVGPACMGTEACSYQYVDPNIAATVTVSAFCSPLTGLCADMAAPCTTDDGCYGYCGLEMGDKAVCGGLGALCNSQEAFAPEQLDVTCNTPAYVCTSNDANTTGQCVLGASLSARSKARRSNTLNGLAHKKIARNSVKVADLRRAAAAALVDAY